MHKSLKCPCCQNERLIDVGEGTKTVLKPIESKTDEFDYYVKCWKCKREIGLKKIS